VLRCVAVCCSVLQCVAVCCSVLQCVAVCCSVLQCVAVCCSEEYHWEYRAMSFMFINNNAVYNCRTNKIYHLLAPVFNKIFLE